MVLIFAVSGLCFADLATAEVILAVNGEAELLVTVTGFHDLTDPNSDFQVRVIEANGRATVAVNPITLYIVVTNDSSAGDLQQHIWRLPVTVARVKSVARINSGIRIVASLDAMPDADIKARELDVLVHYELKNDVLKDTLRSNGEAIHSN